MKGKNKKKNDHIKFIWQKKREDERHLLYLKEQYKNEMSDINTYLKLLSDDDKWNDSESNLWDGFANFHGPEEEECENIDNFKVFDEDYFKLLENDYIQDGYSESVDKTDYKEEELLILEESEYTISETEYTVPELEYTILPVSVPVSEYPARPVNIPVYERELSEEQRQLMNEHAREIERVLEIERYKIKTETERAERIRETLRKKMLIDHLINHSNIDDDSKKDK